jgi:phospholipid transport system substrate-binding protein
MIGAERLARRGFRSHLSPVVQESSMSSVNIRFAGSPFTPRIAAARLVLASLAGLGLAGPAVIAGVATPAAAQAGRQHAAPTAEAFVQTEANKALAILRDSSMSLGVKKQAFYAFINQVADVPKITDFVLGRSRRSLTPAQYSAFAEAFRAYADSVYESRLSDYHGQGLSVTGSIARSPDDVVVTSVITGAGASGASSVVNWRVLRGADGRWHVVDVQAQGVWLAIVEQQDFASTLANHNGDISVLISQLQADAAKGAPKSRNP